MKHRVNLLIDEYEIRVENKIKASFQLCTPYPSQKVVFSPSVIIITLSYFIFSIVRTENFIIAFVGMNWNLFFVQTQHFAMLFVQHLN